MSLTRKEFIKRVSLAGVALQLPWIMSCTSDEEEDRIERNLNFRQTIVDILFPLTHDGPGALEFYADTYIKWYTEEEHTDEYWARVLTRGYENFEKEISDEESFMKLSRNDQELKIAEAYETSWGKEWLSKHITLIFEAMLCHPSYNVNPDEIGWDYLEVQPGYPAPTPELMYPKILETIREN